VELRCHVSCLFFDVRFLSLTFDITCIGIWTAACIAFLFVAFVETLSLQQHFTGVYGDLLTPQLFGHERPHGLRLDHTYLERYHLFGTNNDEGLLSLLHFGSTAYLLD
jgi:hypothetical protein